MSTSSSEIGSRRLDLAGTRDFAVAGAGRARREALSAFNRDWLAEVWRSATGGTHIEGVALAAVGSLGRADAGPLSDYDLVLVHSERSLPAKELTALADRIWYPIWDAGVRLDHSVRTVTQCRQVAAGDLIAAVGLLRSEGVALAAVGSLGRADAGPLSDYDLVLVHSERSLPAKELTALADRIWYPIWDAGVRLDHSVRTVTQCRQVAAGDLIAAVGLL